MIECSSVAESSCRNETSVKRISGSFDPIHGVMPFDA